MQKSFFLPTYEQAVAITQGNECFYEKKTEVNGVQVSVFNYRLAQFKDFDKPIEGSDLNAYELRGLTFVHEASGIKRYLMLHKFFNLNQVPGYQYDEVKHLEVNRVQDKCDGSMVRCLLIGGQLVAKTKMDFTNEQCSMAMEVVNHKIKLKQFILETLARGEVAIFELVSANNRIVLPYQNTDLILLQIRNEETGEYADIYNHDLVLKYGVTCSKSEELAPLDTFVARAEVEENIEGWVLTLVCPTSGTRMMMKKKTKWYCDLHGLLSENLVRENKIMELILSDTMDDAMAQVDETDIRRKYAEDIQKATIVYLEGQLHEVMALKANYKGDRKAYALEYLKHPLFPVSTKLLDYKGEASELAYTLLKNKTLRETSGLMDAKKFVSETLKVKLQHLDEVFEEDN